MQESITPFKYKTKNDLLVEYDQILNMKSAINTEIPYLGWIELELTTEGWNDGEL